MLTTRLERIAFHAGVDPDWLRAYLRQEIEWRQIIRKLRQ